MTIFGPKSSQRRDLFFEKFSNERKNGQTNEKTEGTNENRIVQVVVIVGGVCGRRDIIITETFFKNDSVLEAGDSLPSLVILAPQSPSFATIAPETATLRIKNNDLTQN